VEGALALCAYAASLVDRQTVSEDANERQGLELLLDLMTPVVKSWPSEHCLEANKWAIQVLGGYGYTRDYPVERFYRDNRLNHIHEGAFGIQGLDILGRKVRVAGGRALLLLEARIEETITRADAAGGFDEETSQLRAALQTLLRATETAVACPDLERGLANATLYLDACGDVMIAWMWLWQASVATARLARANAQDADRAFLEGKVAACRYFFRYELPRALQAFALVRTLDDTCLSLTEAQFIGA